jgi:hypothetical protein
MRERMRTPAPPGRHAVTLRRAVGANLRHRMGPSVVLRGLQISSNRCSLSKGLENCLAGVIVSRQMNPKPG